MEAIVVFIVFGSIFGWLSAMRYFKHRERMAEIEARKVEALSASPELRALPPARAVLALELLDAYDETNGPPESIG